MEGMGISALLIAATASNQTLRPTERLLETAIGGVEMAITTLPPPPHTSASAPTECGGSGSGGHGALIALFA